MFTFKDIPFGVIAFMLLMLFAFGYSIYDIVPMQNPDFLWKQFYFNFSFISLVCFLFGYTVLTLPEESFIATNASIILPLLIMVLMWIKTYMIYTTSLADHCNNLEKTVTVSNGQKSTDVTVSAQNADTGPQSHQIFAVLFNSLKLIFTLLVISIFLTFVPSALTPFFELFGSSSLIIYYVGVGTWLGASTWPAEASIYYSLNNSGCLPPSKIEFSQLAEEETQKKNEYV